MRPLAPLDVELTGNRLIEASAGTGKTYTITTLYLRLLLESDLGVDQILVVTFTKAATAELRDRIRQRLRAAVAAFDQDAPTGDAELDGLVGRTADRDRARARQHLARELRRFDEAAIFTIHGFCQRMLRDNAFESGLVFDAELVTDAAPLRTEVVQDFWAREVYDTSDRLVRHLADRKLTLDLLMGLASQAVADPDLVTIPPRAAVDLASTEERYLDAHAAAAELWQRQGEDLRALILRSPALKRTSWREATAERRLGELAAFLTTDPPPTYPPSDFVRFTPARLAEDIKQHQDPLAHPVLSVCAEVLRASQDLVTALDAWLLNLRLDLMDYARQELRRRREASRTLSYDDLLHQLERALRGDGGAALGRIIRERFRAALIDEFQDTDPVQDRIFREIFTHRESLFLIGDPKQAIYGFRRADIYTYLAAGDRVRRAHAGEPMSESRDEEEGSEGCYTLDVNWRADPGLITAVNTLHQRARAPFLDPRIGFEAVRPAPNREQQLQGPGRHGQPFELLFCERESQGLDPGQPINKGWAKLNLPGRVAAEIAQLLASGATVEGRGIAPGDVAVLIRYNAEAAPLQEALRRLAIPSVLHSDASVFQTEEAVELERVLRSLAEPSRDGLLRSALATRLFGLSGEELQALGADEDAWQRWSERFEGWVRQWHGRGFMLVFRRLCESQRVGERLLGMEDGERRLTNLLHLAELLHQAASAQRLGPDGLAHWLGQARAEAGQGGGDESRQMRMESDALAVQILTLHKAKGLEYPVVFCPSLWEPERPAGGKDAVRFHDPEDAHRVKLDLGSGDLEAHRELATREGLAESLRLTYVALTRARNRTVVVWGAFRGAEHSGLAHLLHQMDDGGGNPAAEPRVRMAGVSDAELRADLDRLVEAAAGTVVVSPVGDAEGPRVVAPVDAPLTLAPRAFARRLDRSWRTASFSALTASHPCLSHAAVEGRDLDEEDTGADAIADTTADTPGAAVSPPEPVLLHDFPRGARAGNLLHAIFENLDFTRADTIGPLVRGMLPRFGYEERWATVLEQAVAEILATPLDDTGELRLAGVSQQRRLVELEFVFPVAHSARALTPHRVARAFAENGPALLAGYDGALAALGFPEVRGYLRGFIDLIFEHDGRWYVVDYKSNHLGVSPDDYRPKRLVEPMVSHHYPLQYHLYTVALHRYLRARLEGYDFDRHFGGVRYLFLRGMSPDRPGGGVFQDRPSRALVERLSALVGGEGRAP